MIGVFVFIRLLYQCYGDVAFFHFSLKYMMIYRLGRTRGGGARSAAFPKIRQCKGLFELFSGAKTLEISVYNLLQGWSEVWTRRNCKGKNACIYKQYLCVHHRKVLMLAKIKCHADKNLVEQQLTPNAFPSQPVDTSETKCDFVYHQSINVSGTYAGLVERRIFERRTFISLENLRPASSVRICWMEVEWVLARASQSTGCWRMKARGLGIRKSRYCCLSHRIWFSIGGASLKKGEVRKKQLIHVNRTTFSLAASFWGICLLVSAFIRLRWLELARIYFSILVSHRKMAKVNSSQFISQGN